MNVKMFCDNQGSITLAESKAFHRKVRHIEVRRHHVRDHIAKGDVQVIYIESEAQIADVMMKPLPKVKHQLAIQLLNLQDV